jgi:hypothetical protein
MFRWSAFGLCASIGLFIASAGAVQAQEDGLLAHDINGFALDMTVEQVTSLANAPLVPAGGGQYKAKVDGINYNFGFSAQGHLFRVDSRQELGPFTPDANFANALTERLASKFGPPQANQLPDGPAFWKFQEAYTDAKGQQLNRETESLLVMLTGKKGVSLAVEMMLMDLRIQRRDAGKAN